MRKTLWSALITFLGMNTVSTYAEDQHTDLNSLDIQEIHILGHHANIIGQTLSASEGTISQTDLIIRPLLRTGEILETVPGLVATQHSGSGKANQYFLRGFNLDHGTDFATSIDGIPVNMRTHGHGQGYTDINFIIPELVGGIHYKKGPYYSDVGDFSGAGAANIVTAKTGENQFSLALGEWDFARGLLIGETPAAKGKLLYGVEHQIYSGPWKDIDEDVGKTNLWLKQKWKTDESSFELLFMGYDNQWNSADQIPERAVQQGLIDELGSIDTSVGGESSRYSLSTKFRQKNEKGDLVQAHIYAIDYDMTLWSNFSYFTDPDGDQFQQIDDRIIYGGDLSLTLNRDFLSREMVNTFGVETRVDDIREVGLNRTKAREFLSSIRTDAVDEASISAYWKNTLVLTQHLRTVLGVRQDYVSFDVTPLTAANSNSLELNNNQVSDDITTGSLSVIYTINQQQEIYSSIGQGFHSNDARGVTLSVDPNTAEELNPADPLVGTLGYELGWRGNYNQLNLSVALWHLEIDSELLFVGDEGVTEDTGISSTREGVELTAYFQINNEWMFDIEYAHSNAEFDELLDGSTTIPGALKQVLTTGVNWQVNDRFFTHLRVRHLGEYPLDGGATADASTMVNWRMSYEFNKQIQLTFDVLNLLDSNDRDIEYFYASQLSAEASPVDDHHYHVFEPRSLRLALAWHF
jgi:TonB dependent receptor/TonB-dependent Receptor Plug Domain